MSHKTEQYKMSTKQSKSINPITIQEQQQLSYQTNKLLQYIQLQLSDLQNTLHYIQKKNTLNQIKQSISHSYNIFSETQAIFRELKISFIYQKIKKLVNCFSIIYLILIEQIQKPLKNNLHDIERQMLSRTLLGSLSNIDSQSRLLNVSYHTIQNIRSMTSHNLSTRNNKKTSNLNGKQNYSRSRSPNVQNKSKKKLKPMGGIHLYNEQYNRYVEMNLNHEERKKRKRKEEMKEENSKKDKFNDKKKLREDIYEEFNNNDILGPMSSGPDELTLFFNLTNNRFGSELQSITFQDQLQEIANFFKQSQDEALEFLNKSKNYLMYMNINEGFRQALTSYKEQKEAQTNLFIEKIKGMFDVIKKKTLLKQQKINIKLQELKQLQLRMTKSQSKSIEVQTVHNYEEEISQLNKKYNELFSNYQTLKDFRKNSTHDQQNIINSLQHQIVYKDREISLMKTQLDDKTHFIDFLNEKIKLGADNRLLKKITNIYRNHSIKNNKKLKNQLKLLESEVEKKSQFNIKQQKQQYDNQADQHDNNNQKAAYYNNIQNQKGNREGDQKNEQQTNSVQTSKNPSRRQSMQIEEYKQNKRKRKPNLSIYAHGSPGANGNYDKKFYQNAGERNKQIAPSNLKFQIEKIYNDEKIKKGSQMTIYQEGEPSEQESLEEENQDEIYEDVRISQLIKEKKKFQSRNSGSNIYDQNMKPNHQTKRSTFSTYNNSLTMQSKNLSEKNKLISKLGKNHGQNFSKQNNEYLQWLKYDNSNGIMEMQNEEGQTERDLQDIRHFNNQISNHNNSNSQSNNKISTNNKTNNMNNLNNKNNKNNKQMMNKRQSNNKLINNDNEIKKKEQAKNNNFNRKSMISNLSQLGSNERLVSVSNIDDNSGKNNTVKLGQGGNKRTEGRNVSNLSNLDEIPEETLMNKNQRKLNYRTTSLRSSQLEFRTNSNKQNTMTELDNMNRWQILQLQNMEGIQAEEQENILQSQTNDNDDDDNQSQFEDFVDIQEKWNYYAELYKKQKNKFITLNSKLFYIQINGLNSNNDQNNSSNQNLINNLTADNHRSSYKSVPASKISNSKRQSQNLQSSSFLKKHKFPQLHSKQKQDSQVSITSMQKQQSGNVKKKQEKSFLNNKQSVQGLVQENERSSQQVQALRNQQTSKQRLYSSTYSGPFKQNNQSIWGSNISNQKIQEFLQKGAILIAMKCKNIHEFKTKIKKIHLSKCGDSCKHLQRYLQNFSKYRMSNRATIKMHIENVHDTIEEQIEGKKKQLSNVSFPAINNNNINLSQSNLNNIVSTKGVFPERR